MVLNREIIESVLRKMNSRFCKICSKIKMKKNFYIYIVIISIFLGIGITCKVPQNKKPSKVSTNTSIYPEFSWDKMPLYMHMRKVEPFTDKELNYLSQFPLITLEKTTGSKTFGGTEKGSIEAAKSIKKVNPNAKILYYRNSIINWPSYRNDEIFIQKNPDALLLDSKGEYALMKNMKTKFFDISKKHVKTYWLNNAITHVNNPYIDGIFIDANYKVLTDFMKHKKVDQAKRDALKTNYHEMMGTLKKEIGDNKLIISNILRVRPEPELENGRTLLPYTHGSYIEGFENSGFKKSYEDYLAEGIATVQQSAREGNIIALTLGLGEALEYETEGIDDRRKALESGENIKDRLDYLLAIFLVCAEKYSYVYLHDGFDVNTRKKTGESASKVWMKTFPQYENRLGAPKGPAKKEGYIYTRSFEYLDVWLDLENKKARLDWK